MNEHPFILNERFAIDPSLGTVSDSQSQKAIRIEPRLMNLLCLLAAHKHTLVSRAVITREIWDNYGNADEGLTQAISYLRKILADDDKTLIETVPKKGYILHAAVTEKPAAEEKMKPSGYAPGVIRPKYLFIAIIAVVVLLAAWLVFRPAQPTRGNPDVIRSDQQPGIETRRKSNNPDRRPDTAKRIQPDADKIK
jgi:DNA-binding winged helix-turn-helix (wHTH) protein